MQRLRRSGMLAMCCALALAGGAWAQADNKAYAPTVGQVGKDVVWVPTSQTLVDRMLNMAQLTAKDQLVDLGSGDGRTVITAAKRGATARGIEFNPDLVALSQRAAAAEGVARKATFVQADIFESDFSHATVVTLFLLPELNLRLRPKLLDMKPGTRVVSNSFDMGDWQPDERVQVADDCSSFCNAYKWIVPAKVAGTWSLEGQPLELTQSFQMLGGSYGPGGVRQQISDARMDGSRIRFTIGADQYTGRVEGAVMSGTVNGGKAWTARRSS